jgi:hypothetical protein
MAPLGADLLVDGCAALAGGEDATEISVSLVDLGEQPRWGGSPDGAAPVEAAAAALLLGTAGPPAVAVRLNQGFALQTFCPAHHLHYK